MRAEDFDIQKIVNTLQGTCGDSIQSALDYHYPDMIEDDLNEEDHRELDDQLFVCDCCGWWYETSERNDTNGEGDYCEDCHESEFGED